MSSDPWQDLSTSLGKMCHAFDDAMEATPGSFLPSSPAANETGSNPHAGEWSGYPISDLCAYAVMLGYVQIDHLRTVASALVDAKPVYAYWTLARSAFEASSVLLYLVDPTISASQRAQRLMSWRLDSRNEEWRAANGLRDLYPDYVKTTCDRLESSEQKILKTAKKDGLKSTEARLKNGGRRAAWVGEAFPTTMDLVGRAIPELSKEFGTSSYRQLSAVAHSDVHGLWNFVEPTDLPSPAPGHKLISMQVSVKQLAIQLRFVLIAVGRSLITLLVYLGRNKDLLDLAYQQALLLWSRVADRNV